MCDWLASKFKDPTKFHTHAQTQANQSVDHPSCDNLITAWIVNALISLGLWNPHMDASDN